MSSTPSDPSTVVPSPEGDSTSGAPGSSQLATDGSVAAAPTPTDSTGDATAAAGASSTASASTDASGATGSTDANALPTTTNDSGTTVVADESGKPVEGDDGSHIEVDPSTGIPVTKTDDQTVVVADPATGAPALTDGQPLPLADATTTQTNDGTTVVAQKSDDGSASPAPFTDNSNQPIPVAAPTGDVGSDPAGAVPGLPTLAGAQSSPDAPTTPPSDGSPSQDAPPANPPAPPIDGNPTLPPPPTPSAPSDSNSEGGGAGTSSALKEAGESSALGSDSASASSADPSTATTPSTPASGSDLSASPTGQAGTSSSDSESSTQPSSDAGASSSNMGVPKGGLIMGHTDISQSPAPTDGPEVHIGSGEPLTDADKAEPGDDANTGVSGDIGAAVGAAAAASTASSGDSSSDPVDVDPPVAAPTAANLTDTYTGMTDDGQGLFQELEDYAENTGAALSVELKAAANYAASVVAKLEAAIQAGALGEESEKKANSLLHAFHKVEHAVKPYLTRDDSVLAGQGESLADKVVSALKGVESAVRDAFAKLKG